ncbi:MAG TPA: deoxyguanosinetriphosphate triphosphohydrolase [Candidatus Ruthenibacterium merdavium]|uniref:Deoxyguanosinetriphosphate triphosphohydrolase n=1 Tax=Candidatus Ruthenibacterium merdavium TaxID=2838752 RepID=A0A9D2Q480_9FIRM|nr:deoxyguanosinetriphosphate triphosphohydrolase [Candidatus Ruthenibacterium merdavium]
MTVRERIEQIERNILCDWATFSDNSAGRARQEAPCPMRTCFQRDRDRILHSRAFRRLKQKTQVFLCPEGDHYRTRLTHTLEVSQIARTAARGLRLNEDLTEAIALGHDVGHTPFGHAGERALNRLSPQGFRHYQQSVRVLQVLEKNGQGLNLCAEVLDGIAHHTKGTLPMTPEGCIVRYADRIAYMNHDMEDGVKAGVFSIECLPADIVRVLGNTKSARIATLVSSLVENSDGVIAMSSEVQQAYEALHAFLYSTLYVDERAKHEEKKVEKLVADLYEYFCEHPMQMPQGYLYILYDQGVECAVTDFISGMSDAYAVRLYEELFVPKRWAVL